MTVEEQFDAKHKPKVRAGRAFPVTFVVDQQLEACVLAIKKNSRRSNVQIDLINEHKDADRVDFSAALFHDGKPMTHVWGTLRRWQGTSTRVEGYARTLYNDSTNMLGCYVTGFSFFGILLASPSVLFSPQRFPSLWPTMILIVLCIGLGVIVVLGHNYINKRRLIRRLRKLFQTQPLAQSQRLNKIEGR